ncbi:hypothetical protein B0H21DRAFT_892603 [Amylocystis lapponica]|nr:hypothetical protein B0H21DRAFT_892603 [Amylocystis lapponica]
MKVIDNFAHDVIRYNLRTLEPCQGLVTIDANGDFSTYYTRVTDPLISSFLGRECPVVQTRYQNTTVPCSTLLIKHGYFDIFFPTGFERLRDVYEHLSQPPPCVSPLATSTSLLAIGKDFFSSYHRKSRRTPLDGIVKFLF